MYSVLKKNGKLVVDRSPDLTGRDHFLSSSSAAIYRHFSTLSSEGNTLLEPVAFLNFEFTLSTIFVVYNILLISSG